MAARRRVTRRRPAAALDGRRAGRGRGAPPVLAVSGPSGSGKTRLLRRLIPVLAARGLRVAVLKHTRHAHPFDQAGKDTEVLRRAGAVATAVQGPEAMALFGPPLAGAGALAALLPPCDLVLAEGWRGEPLPRLEVHRRRVSRAFLCAGDRRVLAVVTDEPPPRPLPTFGAEDLEGVADFVAGWLARAGRAAALAPASRAAAAATPRRRARPSGS